MWIEIRLVVDNRGAQNQRRDEIRLAAQRFVHQLAGRL
jgi:hypothetical protein